MYGGRRGIAPFVLNFDPRWRWVGNATPPTLRQQKITPVPTEQEAGWAPGPAWVLWRKEKFLVPTGIRAQDRPARIVVAISTPTDRRKWVDIDPHFFYVLLTVHLSIILVINQLIAQILVLSQPVHRTATYRVLWYQMLYNTILPPDDEHNSARNM